MEVLTVACMSGGDRIVDGLMVEPAGGSCASGQPDTLQRVSIVVASTFVSPGRCSGCG